MVVSAQFTEFFFTGSSAIPLQGFGRPLTVSFLHGDDLKLPMVSTCSLQLRVQPAMVQTMWHSRRIWPLV